MTARLWGMCRRSRKLPTLDHQYSPGSAGIFDLSHLALIRQRVEGAVTFLHSILRV